MSDEPQYFRYVVAQYAHSRRDERLNVGVIVHDPVRATVRSFFDTNSATRRVKLVFPDVDARGLTLFLRDFRDAVMTNPGLNERLDQPDALKTFGNEWQNALQFTPVRSIPAANITRAVEALAQLYVTEIPEELQEIPKRAGVPYVVKQTERALRDVLHLEVGVNYGEFRAERSINRLGKTHHYAVVFPFFVYDQFVIDAVSFKTRSFREQYNVASGFLERIEDLRRLDGGRDLVPCLSYVADEESRDDTEALVARIQDKAGLPEDSIVEASNAEDLARFIGANRNAAA